jgi:hypothetical protein
MMDIGSWVQGKGTANDQWREESIATNAATTDRSVRLTGSRERAETLDVAFRVMRRFAAAAALLLALHPDLLGQATGSIDGIVRDTAFVPLADGPSRS